MNADEYEKREKKNWMASMRVGLPIFIDLPRRSHTTYYYCMCCLVWVWGGWMLALYCILNDTNQQSRFAYVRRSI